MSSRGGKVTEFALPKRGITPSAIVAGLDGNVWFVAGDVSGSPGIQPEIGRTTPQGIITEFALPASVTFGCITLGPDGALWFTDTAAGMIDRLKVARSG